MFRALIPLCTALSLIAPGITRGSDIYVPDDHPTIQDAIDAALDGDNVIVRQGTYLEHITFYGKAICVKSKSGPSVTMIDGSHDYRVVKFQFGEGNSSRLEGFTITNGNDSGIYCWQSSPTLVNNRVNWTKYGSASGLVCSENSHPVVTSCRFYNNKAYGINNQGNSNPVVTYCDLSRNNGGMRNQDNSNPLVSNCLFDDNSNSSGMENWSSHPTVENCTFSNNVGGMHGGGIYCRENSRPIVAGCTFIGNRAGSVGGGIGNGYESNNTSTVTNCLFIQNSASSGGGVGNTDDGSDATYTNCLFLENTATTGHGGGFSASGSSPRLINCSFIGNEADDNGGGFSGGVNAALINCLFTINSAENGGGAYLSGQPTLDNCTFTGGYATLDGGGIYCSDGSSPVVTNSILWNDTPDEIYVDPLSSPTVSFSCVQGGFTGSGNIDVDPLFADPVFDCHLTWDSPCRDTGDSSAVVSTEDFEGDPRVAGGDVDMGADEFHVHLYAIGDIVPGVSVDVKVVGAPGTTPVTLGLGSGIKDPPQSTIYGLLYLEPPIYRLSLGTIPSNGILTWSTVVPNDWNSGEQYPLQALVGVKLSNLMVLTVE